MICADPHNPLIPLLQEVVRMLSDWTMFLPLIQGSTLIPVKMDKYPLYNREGSIIDPNLEAIAEQVITVYCLYLTLPQSDPDRNTGGSGRSKREAIGFS
jgi:hypothetical protein